MSLTHQHRASKLASEPRLSVLAMTLPGHVLLCVLAHVVTVPVPFYGVKSFGTTRCAGTTISLKQSLSSVQIATEVLTMIRFLTISTIVPVYSRAFGFSGCTMTFIPFFIVGGPELNRHGVYSQLRQASSRHLPSKR